MHWGLKYPLVHLETPALGAQGNASVGSPQAMVADHLLVTFKPTIDDTTARILANVMGLVSSNIFRTQDAPRYEPALITTACFGAAGALITLCMGMFMIWDNRRRDRRSGVKIDPRDIPTSRLRDGPSSPEFRWFL